MRITGPAFWALVGTAASFAAPTLTLSNMQTVGDVSTTVDIDTATISSVGDAGAGVTWDFSGLKSGLATKRYGLAPSSTPYASLYPGATHCERTVQSDTKVDNYQYYLAGGGSMQVIGLSGGVIDSTRYVDPDEVMKLPFTFGDSLYDSASLTQYMHSGMKMQTEQGRTTVADGYGTLKLPNGTFDNVLRYRVTTDQAIKVVSGTNVLMTIHYHVVDYFWADQGYQEFLLEYHPVMLKDGVQQSRRGNYWTDPKAVGATRARLAVPGKHVRAANAALGGSGWLYSKQGIPSLRNVLGRVPALKIRADF